MSTRNFLICILINCILFAACSKSHDNTINNNGNGGNVTVSPPASKVTVETYAGKTVNSIQGPGSLCIDATGFLYVAEMDHNVVVKIDPLIQTIGKFAGLFNTPGCVDDPFGSGAPSLTFPENIWMSSDQQVYIGDYGCGKLKIANTTGGLASLGYENPYLLAPSIDAGCKDFKGNIYFMDTYDGLFEVRQQDKVLVSVISGGQLGIASSMTMDAAGKNIYIAANHRIFEYTIDGSLLPIAGDSLSIGNKDGQGKSASFGGAMAITAGTDGNIYVCDINNNTIRQVTPNGAVTTIAGDGNSGFADGSGDKAEFASPRGIVFTTSGDNNILYVSDYENNLIRKITFPKS